MPSSKVLDALFGLAVGDALGVPHEFRPRRDLDKHPVVGMDGWGTWNQAPGTWSDDSSLSFCLAETLSRSYDLHDLAARFVAWQYDGYWTAGGETFDVGRSTAAALERLRADSTVPASAGGRRERDNGNGSLMRILPAVFHVHGCGADERFWIVAELSSLTHAHRRSQLACIILIEIAVALLGGVTPTEACRDAAAVVLDRFAKEDELAHFDRTLSGADVERNDIVSSGYVVDTLEAALWCLRTTGSYRDAVLRAVNLGGDTDTVASVTGGLAGLAYGAASIPSEWLAVLAGRDRIEDLADRLARKTGFADAEGAFFAERSGCYGFASVGS